MFWVNDSRSFGGILEKGVQLHTTAFSIRERLQFYYKGRSCGHQGKHLFKIQLHQTGKEVLSLRSKTKINVVSSLSKKVKRERFTFQLKDLSIVLAAYASKPDPLD